MQPLIWQMLYKMGWFVAEAVLCNLALANEQFPLKPEFSLSGRSEKETASLANMCVNASGWYQALPSAPTAGLSPRHKSHRRCPSTV